MVSSASDLFPTSNPFSSACASLCRPTCYGFIGIRPISDFESIRVGIRVADLRAGDFTVRLFTLDTRIAFSSTLSWSNMIKYDNVSEVMGFNSRLHWIPEGGRQAFLVFNYGLQDFDKDNTFDSTSSDISLKFNYTFRF